MLEWAGGVGRLHQEFSGEATVTLDLKLPLNWEDIPAPNSQVELLINGTPEPGDDVTLFHAADAVNPQVIAQKIPIRIVNSGTSPAVVTLEVRSRDGVAGEGDSRRDDHRRPAGDLWC